MPEILKIVCNFVRLKKEIASLQEQLADAAKSKASNKGADKEASDLKKKLKNSTEQCDDIKIQRTFAHILIKNKIIIPLKR